MPTTGLSPLRQEPPPTTTPIAPYLGSIANAHRVSTRSSIRHETVQPVIDVECGVEGRDLGAVASDIDAAVKNLGKLPPGVEVKVSGQSETMFAAFGRLGLGMVVAIALVYLLLVVLFQSWIDPLLIMLAVPASLSGVLWMLTITGTTLNVESLMGAIMAIGHRRVEQHPARSLRERPPHGGRRGRRPRGGRALRGEYAPAPRPDDRDAR